MGVTERPTKLFADQVTAKGHQLRALEIYDVARCLACALEMRSSNGTLSQYFSMIVEISKTYIEHFNNGYIV